MTKFKLVSFFDEKKIRKYSSSNSWKQCPLLPWYGERYVCFSRNEENSFEELVKTFLKGNSDERIGAISMIAERYPGELYQLICNQRDFFSLSKLRYIFYDVIPSYLPLYLPKERLMDYEFVGEFSNDIWVKILVELRTRMKTKR